MNRNKNAHKKGFERKKLANGQPNPRYVDLLLEDKPIAGQHWACMSFVTPSKILKKIKVESLRFYLAGNNLFTLTKYQGFDPDISSPNALSAGVDYGFYPQARSLMLGFSIRF